MFRVGRFLCITRIIALICCLADTAGAQQPPPAIIRGSVRTAAGEPLPYANIYIENSFEGTVSNREGAFRFSSRLAGPRVLIASMMGFERRRLSCTLSPGDTITAVFVLRETLIRLQEAVVTASAFSTGDARGVTLSSLEVVTTPGAAADIFLAIKSLPGVAMVDEGSGLFVRGGDVTETLTLLDQATVAHPYKYESPTGGVFGTIPPFLIKGTYFTAGGFSARYGNALSGVLAMQSQEMPERPEFTFGMGLAAASLGASAKVAGDKLGFRLSGNRSFTDALFRLNGRRRDFVLTPRGADGSASLIYRYSPSGRVKFFSYFASDRLGVHAPQPGFAGIYRGDETNRLHNLQWTDILSGWLARTSFSANLFETRRSFGNLDLRQRDRLWKLRTDWEKQVSDRFTVAAGFEHEMTESGFSGKIPVQKDVLHPGAATVELSESATPRRTGGYVESTHKLGRKWLARAGLRFDYHSTAQEIVFDPRFSLRWQPDRRTNLRLSFGGFHQFPLPYQLNETSGNPDLGAMQAMHAIATLEHFRSLFHFRIELYAKKYNRLVLENNERNFANTGHGDARGCDIFLKYGGFLRSKVSGWLAYSLLRSRRTHARHLGETLVYELAPSDFDITHNLTLVAKTQLYQLLSLGVSYRFATGRPVTPVIDALPQEPYGYYLPVEGAINSERLPAFQRLDANLSLYVPFGYGNAAIFYLALSNVLNRANVLDYDYSANYSNRSPRRTHYRRFVYFGVSVSFAGRAR